MDISVVICTYNRPLRLRGAIESCLRQSVLPIEIIVVDDGSLEEGFIDEVRLLVEGRGVKWNYIRKGGAERGLTRSRNIGWRIAIGDVIQFLDDDAELPSLGLEFAKKVFLSDRDNEIVAIDFPIEECAMDRAGRRVIEFCYSVAGLWKVGLRFYRCRRLPESVRELGYCRVNRFLQGGSMLIRKESLEDIGGFDEELGISAVGEDKEVSIRLGKIGCIGRINSLFVRHYSEPAGRVDGFRYGCETGFNYLYINNKIGKLGAGEWLLIGYNVVILICTETLFAFVGNSKFHVSQIKGLLAGIYRFVLMLCRHRTQST